jgi:hypothetical protein
MLSSTFTPAVKQAARFSERKEMKIPDTHDHRDTAIGTPSRTFALTHSRAAFILP